MKKKCGNGEYCETLIKCLDDKKGLSGRDIFNEETLEVTRTIIVANLGEFRKKGIVFNYCPFCGERIFQNEECK